MVPGPLTFEWQWEMGQVCLSWRCGEKPHLLECLSFPTTKASKELSSFIAGHYPGGPGLPGCYISTNKKIVS